MRRLSGIEAVAFEGGGSRGIAYLPVIEALEMSGAQIKEFAGASAGAITATLLALGAPYGWIKRTTIETDWRRFAYRPWWRAPNRLWRLWKEKGLHSLAYPRKWLENALTALSWPLEGTFGDLMSRGVRLCVTATDEVDLQGVLFSPETTPDQAILPSVLASMAIPIFYPPVEIGGRPYSDGGLTWNFPIDTLQAPPEKILGVRLDSPAEINPALVPWRSAKDRALRITKIAKRTANRSHVPSHLWPRVVQIDTGGAVAIDFDITDTDIHDLVRAGALGLSEWMKKEEAAA